MSEPTYTVKKFAEMHHTTPHTVLTWIHDGILPAIDISRKQGGRPTYIIKQSGLMYFEQVRGTMPPAKIKNKQPSVTKYIK